jgi:hypothetical protein
MNTKSQDEAFAHDAPASDYFKHMVVTAYIPINHGSLVALVDVECDCFTVREVRYYRDGAAERVAPPTRLIAPGREYWIVAFKHWELQQEVARNSVESSDPR